MAQRERAVPAGSNSPTGPPLDMAPHVQTGPASFAGYNLGLDTPTDPALQSALEQIDAGLRRKLDMTESQSAAGVLDLRRLRLAMLHPDRIEYGASVPKVGILLAWFELHPEAVSHLDPTTRRDLGLMIKASSNEIAARFSHELGLANIQKVLRSYGLYDDAHGGGIWVGKHYGETGERIGDPVGDHSHAVTIRQLLRFSLLLEQGRLVSPQASSLIREIFLSPEIPHDRFKFLRGLAGRNLVVRRKSGWWEDWLHDSAVITGPGRHYILAGLTNHPKGNDYLEALASAMDDLLQSG